MDLRVIATLQVFVLNFFIVREANASGYCLDPGYTPSNGSRNPSVDMYRRYFPESIIRYECDIGYKLKPNQNIQTCKSNIQGGASWLPEKPPSCVKVAVCPKPDIKHATIWKDVFHEGDYLNDYFSCDSGYTFDQNNIFWCLETGEWSDIPSCAEKNCTYPPIIQNGYHRFYSPKEMPSSPTEWPPGTTVFYECEPSYQLEPASQNKRVCETGEWSGADPECVQNGCLPPDPSEGRYIPVQNHYEVHNTITYICLFDDEDVTRTCKTDHTWSGTPCSNVITTQQMPYTPSHNDNVYCTTPSHVMHGSFDCCSKEQVTNNGGTEDYCCPVRGVVKFACDVGYMTKDVTQWICGTGGEWISVNSDNSGTPNSPPTCYSNTTRPNPDTMPDEILRPVIGVAAGVFLILSVAIIIAFCRPKIKDMKRRWRKLREDDDEIIIDGRRILLPSYEEAITSSNPYLAQITEPRSSSSCPVADGPSTSQGYDNVNMQDDASMIFEVHRESTRKHPRTSSNSDEEMLVPNNLEERPERSKVQKIENGSGVAQPLILSAGIDVDAYVLINKPSNENFNENSPPVMESDEGKTQCQLTDRHDLSANFSLVDVSKPLNDFNDSENDSDTNLDSIFPKTILMTENNGPSQQPPVIEGHNLLSYPIMPSEADSGEQCEHEAISIRIEPENINLFEPESANTNLTNFTAVKNEENGNLSEREDYESQPIGTNSDHIHIVMSQTSNVNNEQQQDETGSTTV